jgi:hypothetical protein
MRIEIGPGWQGPPETDEDERSASLFASGLIRTDAAPGLLETIGLDAHVVDRFVRWWVGTKRRRQHTLAKFTSVCFFRETEVPIGPIATMADPRALWPFDPGTAATGTVNPSTTCPFVKVRVLSPQWPGPVVIDIDRSIIVPSPSVCAQVIGLPRVSDETGTFPAWVEVNGNTTPIDGQVWDVFLFAKLCHEANFPSPFPILTEFVRLEESQDQSFIRPRAARRLFISGQTAAQVWTMRAGRGGNIMGEIHVPAGETYESNTLPGFTQLDSFTAPAGGANVTIAWDVQP